jgi:NTP pyrophosphatase (non-canonical NTP hydrolase)
LYLFLANSSEHHEVLIMNQKNNDNRKKPLDFESQFSTIDGHIPLFSSSNSNSDDDPFSDKRTKEIADVIFRTKKKGIRSINDSYESFSKSDYDLREVQKLVLKDVVQERKRQASIWGEQRHNSHETWNVIGVEEVGEVARAIYEKDDISHLYEEIIQVAAVYVAWAESIQQLNERV